MESKWVELIYFTSLIIFNVTLAYEEDQDLDSKTDDKRSEVEVRAVFINCESEDLASDSETTRFERAELFKHGALKDCSKKLALTVKITSEADSSGDEYLPIEHVFEGSNNKQIRLLDPYILRLRRDTPLQAYKLRRLETVRGVFLMSPGFKMSSEKHYEDSRSRIQRDVSSTTTANVSKLEIHNVQSNPELLQDGHQVQLEPLLTTERGLDEFNKCEKNHFYTDINDTINKRCKRNEHNIVIEGVTDEDPKWISKDNFHRVSDRDRKKYSNDLEDGINKKSIKVNHKKETVKKVNTQYAKLYLKKNHRSNVKTRPAVSEEHLSKRENSEILEAPEIKFSNSEHTNLNLNKNTISKPKKADFNDHVYSAEKDYALYEIGVPELWYAVHVQLFEKLSTPEGKTVWNDLTKGDIASVSSLTPEWTGQDLNVRYRSTRWIPRDEYTLPSKPICLLAHINADRGYINTFAENVTSHDSALDDAEYIVVPEEDIIRYSEDDINKRNGDNSEADSAGQQSASNEQKHSKVIVRVANALLGGREEKFNIASRGSNKYLTLPHRRQQRAQLDLEARADNNELVRIGSSGRISIAVADSTRKKRTVLNLQVGNTGLAAARFRVSARDFDPLISDLLKEATNAGPILVPPRHTRSLRIELPIEIPVDVAHCTVALINDQDQSVAVRDIAIKKGDRCFCVWHCDCVCLSDDPNLLCREMDEARQQAAGLSTRDRVRHTRSVCYCNIVSLNFITVFFGVLLFAMICGFVKATLGLVCEKIANYGLDQVVHMPRKIEHYYEDNLRNQRVVYDKDGWPVHPQTKQRTVRQISKPMEFVINMVFFLIWPCCMIYDALLKLKQTFTGAVASKPVNSSFKKDHKKCFSSQDMQDKMPRWRRRRACLRRWMTPEAQELSSQLWHKSLSETHSVKCSCLQPLLGEKRSYKGGCEVSNVTMSCPDSEQDDTDYVLTQMQKSRESLARSQKKQNEHLDATSPIAKEPNK